VDSAIEWQLRYLSQFNWLRRCMKKGTLEDQPKNCGRQSECVCLTSI